MEEDWVLLTTVADMQRAEIIKAMLEGENIETVLLNKRDSVYLVGQVEIYCHVNKAYQALQLLEKGGYL